MDNEEEAKFWPQQQGDDAVNELEERYNRLVSKLMILQGQREKDEITDSQVRSRFQGLQQAIKTWVNKVRQDLLRNGHQDVVRQAVDGGYDRPGMSRLMYLLSVNGEAAETDDASTAFTSDDIEWAQWLGCHPTAIHVVLFLGVWSGLQKYILRRSFPIGIDEHSEQMFKEVIKTMDKERAQKWMSQTMTALAKTSIFEKGRTTQMEFISEEMRIQLEMWPLGPFSTRSTHYQSLKELVKLAADLHRDLRCSKDRFEMVYPRNLVRGRLPDDVSNWDLMNLTQWLLLSGKEDSEGALLCLYPGLDRHVTDDNATVNISKPTVIVYDVYDGENAQRSNSTQSTPQSPYGAPAWSDYPQSYRPYSSCVAQESQPLAWSQSSPREDERPPQRPRAGSSPNLLSNSTFQGPGMADSSRVVGQDTKRSSKAGGRTKRSGRKDGKRSPDEGSVGSKKKKGSKRSKRKEGSSKARSTSDKTRGQGDVTTKIRSGKGSKTPPEVAEGSTDKKHYLAREPGRKSPEVVTAEVDKDEEDKEEESSSPKDSEDSDSQPATEGLGPAN